MARKRHSDEHLFNLLREIELKLSGGSDVAYAITDTDQVCVSMAADKGRYRCLTAVRHGDVVQKFNARGKMTFELLDFEPSTGL